uniref:Uncharacterized protein n=1 Tax=Pyramimonas orientalis virus TaxID=455367 RepID=A0A7L9AZ65_POV01|nr:hypothetical protein HWQ62_00479 [Pyramimonas orientalis virus]
MYTTMFLLTSLTFFLAHFNHDKQFQNIKKNLYHSQPNISNIIHNQTFQISFTTKHFKYHSQPNISNIIHNQTFQISFTTKHFKTIS